MTVWEAGQAQEHPLSSPALASGFGTADRLARAVSIVCAPPVMLLPLAVLVGFTAPSSPGLLSGVLAFVVATALLPSLFVYGQFRRGAVGSVDLTRRSERLQPAIVATLCAGLAYPLLRALGAPSMLLQVDAALVTQLAILGIVTTWWKISYHAASAAGLALAGFSIGGAASALPLVGMAMLVGWARVRLGRHTPMQVTVGWLTSAPLLWWTWPG